MCEQQMSWKSNKTKMVLLKQGTDCECEANLFIIIQCDLVISLVMTSKMRLEARAGRCSVKRVSRGDIQKSWNQQIH